MTPAAQSASRIAILRRTLASMGHAISEAQAADVLAMLDQVPVAQRPQLALVPRIVADVPCNTGEALRFGAESWDRKDAAL